MKFYTITLALFLFASTSLISQITYTDSRDDFFVDCSEETLSFEDFEGGPVGGSLGINACDQSISAAGDVCFVSGEIVEGFTISASIGPAVYFETGSFDHVNPGVGADQFASFVIIDFEEADVTAVSFDLNLPLTFNPAPIEVRIFGENSLLDSRIYDGDPNGPVFVGINSEEPITIIELENLSAGLETVSQLYFGNCEETTSTGDVVSFDFEVYPNPASDLINMTTPSSAISSADLFDLAGNLVLSYKAASYNNSAQLDISLLPQGVYFLEITNLKQEKVRSKILKK